MDIGNATLADVVRLAVGALGGAAVGLERQWSGHASGQNARLAGIRTFTLLGGLGAMAGWLLTRQPMAAGVILAGAVALVVAGYVAASRRGVEATTEVAAVAVLGTGVLAGLGELALSSGIVATIALLLSEKSRLHGWVERIDDRSMGAAFRFAVMAAVILPLLPQEPIDPFGWIRPRPIWLLVLFFSGLSFAGYVARLAVGPRQGYAVAGLLGGFVSSTSVTLTYARLSHTEPDAAEGLATGVIAASTLSIVRVLVAVAVLEATLIPRLTMLLAPALAVGLGMSWWSISHREAPAPAVQQEMRNPLQLGMALKLALLFQALFVATPYIEQWLGDPGLLASSFVLGLATVDALIVSVAHGTTDAVSTQTAALAIAIGVLSNTLAKVGMVATLGQGAFRARAGVGLVILGAVAAGTIAILWSLRTVAVG